MSDEEDFESDGPESDEGEIDDDESFDYGFAQDGEDDEEYEIDYNDMNMGPDILRLLGASEEVIAAKEREISSIKWEAPKVAGLEHSSAIANFDDVALSGGKKGQTSGTTERIFKTIGSYDGPSGVGHAPPTSNPQSSHGEAPTTDTAVLKVKISQAPEAVPKGKESKLPPAPEIGSEDDSSASDTSWDEESVIDGHAWWEDMSDEEVTDGLNSRISYNLRTAFGLADSVQDPAKTDNNWRPPSSSGLSNSKPLVTLQPVGVGTYKGMEVKYMRGGEGDGDSRGSTNEGNSQEESGDEGWDHTDIPDEDYILEWSTNISPNLSSALENAKSPAQLAEKLSREISWRPPTTYGLGNSAPIIMDLAHHFGRS